MILLRDPASYAEANYNIDNYALNFDRFHSSNRYYLKKAYVFHQILSIKNFNEKNDFQ